MIQSLRSVHFVGVCGTAMASVAVALQQRGVRVSGSDQNMYPPMSTFLAGSGVELFEGYRESNLDRQPELVVIGNAISRGNPEAEAALDRRLRYCSLPELLKHFFIQGKRSLVVAGTHGKTTTTSLLTWVFEQAGLMPSYLIGGIPRNLGQGARFTESEWFILEGDEYDTAFFDKRSKFMHYLPEVAILNNLEFDHADIFDDVASIQLSFRRFLNVVPRNGLVLANGDDPGLAPLLGVKHCPVRRFGLGHDNDYRATAIRLLPETSEFTLGEHTFRIGLTGELNVRNALAVAACSLHCGLDQRRIQAAFDSFTGVRRRMDVRGTSDGVTVVDDFGHHPTAIRETVRALQVKFPGRRLVAVFEPRTNTTRRNVFQSELAAAFEGAHEVVIAQVARLELLKPEDRLNPERLMSDLRARGHLASYLPDVDRILEHLIGSARAGDVVCIFSNGGFGNIHDRLLASLETRGHATLERVREIG